VDLPAVFPTAPDQPVGEIWFVGEERLPLLAKYLFTSESLSVQVHPDDDQARSRGLPRGKAECWFVIDAEPGARIGLGLREEMSPDMLRRAALDGTVEQFIAWRPVSPGDFFLVPPGTIHAIGAGISLLELQQNSDVTYRLYDYGRGRDLHLDDGIAVAQRNRYPDHFFQSVDPAADVVLVDGPHFTLVHSHGDALQSRERLILPIDGFAAIGDDVALPGECLLLHEHQRLDSAGGRLLVAAAPTVEPIQLQVAA
jgi:mannose-6-phosphate isomerase